MSLSGPAPVSPADSLPQVKLPSFHQDGLQWGFPNARLSFAVSLLSHLGELPPLTTGDLDEGLSSYPGTPKADLGTMDECFVKDILVTLGMVMSSLSLEVCTEDG